MKFKFLITLTLAMIIQLQTTAQSINGVPLDSIDVEYVQIVGTSKLFSNKVTIQIDFGQEDKVWVQKDTQIKGKNGELLVFNSKIDALNFMSANGYLYVDDYAITMGNTNVYHYLLRRQ